MALNGYHRPEYYPERVPVYVPNMEFASDVDDKGMCLIDLGTPVALDADGILAALDLTSAATTTSFAATYDPDNMGRYGRNVTMVCSGSNTDAVTVNGRDYLNQKISETFTLAGTTTVNGKKAFKYIDSIVTLAEASRTLNVGWGDALGLPYRTLAVVQAMDAGEPADDMPAESLVDPVSVIVADAASATFTSPIDGYIVGWRGIYTTAMTTAPSVITAHVNGAAKTAGDGVAPIGLAGLVFGKQIARANWIPVAKGDTILLTSDGAGTAGVADMAIMLAQSQGVFAQAVDTDPQTATTGDPRGTWDPGIATNGTRKFSMVALVDRQNLHGVAHYSA